MGELTIRILHKLPNRLRVRLDPAPLNVENMRKIVRRHPGIESFAYTVRTRSVLIHYDTAEVSEAEILLRVALCLSMENDLAPVQLRYADERDVMTPAAVLSGMSILLSGTARILPWFQSSRLFIDWAAGIGTAGAVLEHAWSEVKQMGNFHPESLSVVYLLTSFVRTNVLPAAAVTWISTFGRHLLKPLERGVEVHAVAKTSGRRTSYELTVGQSKGPIGRRSILLLLPAVLADALSSGKPGEGSLFKQIENVSRSHGEKIEGLSELKNGITIRIE
jgi:hypothetical protein